MNTKWGVLALLVLGLPGCRGCGIAEGETTYEKLHGKVEVELVRKTHWNGFPVTDFYLHVNTTPPFEDELPHGICDHVDMDESADGKFVAFRCHGAKTKDWTVLRLRGEDRYLRECHAPVGTGKKPDYAKLGSVRAAIPRMMARDCAVGAEEVKEMGEVVRTVREDEDANAAADALAELGTFGAPDPYGADAWDATYAKLEPSAQPRARAGLCKFLESADPNHRNGYVRAAMRCEPTGAAVADAALATFEALSNEDPNRMEPISHRALEWSGVIALETRPKEAGTIACAAIERRRPESIYPLVLGRTRTSCAAVDRWLAAPLCTGRIDCDGGLCTQVELDREVAALARPLDGGLRSTPILDDEARYQLYAGYVRGPLPPDMVLANARRNYGFDAGTGPDCSETALDAGAPCKCTDVVNEVCNAKPNDKVARIGFCAVRIDDAHHRLGDVRKACEDLGGACDSNHRCCGAAMCEDARCRAEKRN